MRRQARQSQPGDDAAPILVPAHVQSWTFGDHLRLLAEHAGTLPPTLMSLAAVPIACGVAGSGRTADRSFDRRPRPIWSSCARIINQMNRETEAPTGVLKMPAPRIIW